MRCGRGSEAALSLLIACTLAGCTPLPPAPVVAPPRVTPPRVTPTRVTPTRVTPTGVSPAPVSPVSPALTLLARLRVQGRGPLTGYDRAAFGQPWADADRNGCDTRNDVLRRDLTDVVTRAGTHGCVVVRGTLQDPYTGAVVPHVRGGGRVEVDHVVALADAWQEGASTWPWARRVALANDPLDLLATTTATNRSKGSGDAATWLPPLQTARCAFAARQVAVKVKYALGVTGPERDALRRLLAACPGEPAPTSDAPTEAPLRSPAPRPAAPRG